LYLWSLSTTWEVIILTLESKKHVVYRALLVDDEPLAREDLSILLKEIDAIKIEWEAATIAETKEILSNNQPDVIFLDVQLRGGTGFDLLPFIHPSTSIVFVTAFDQYAIRAFEVNALDYLTKPVGKERLRMTIDRLSCKSEEPQEDSDFGEFEKDDKVFLQSDDVRRFVDLEDIVAIVSIGGNYTSVVLNDGESPSVRRTFKDWENRLPHSQFLRVHRTNIVNTRRIRSLERNSIGSYKLFLSGYSKPFSVSRQMLNEVKGLFGHKI